MMSVSSVCKTIEHQCNDIQSARSIEEGGSETSKKKEVLGMTLQNKLTDAVKKIDSATRRNSKTETTNDKTKKDVYFLFLHK